MRNSSPEMTPDLYVGCFCDVRAWGGGLSAANGLLAAAERRELSGQLLGVSRTGSEQRPSGRAPQARAHNVPLGAQPLLWRVQSWRIPTLLAQQLRRLPRPRRAFVAVSVHWAIAAKRAWPDTPVVYVFPCLLSNCLPFTWRGGCAADDLEPGRSGGHSTGRARGVQPLRSDPGADPAHPRRRFAASIPGAPASPRPTTAASRRRAARPAPRASEQRSELDRASLSSPPPA